MSGTSATYERGSKPKEEFKESARRRLLGRQLRIARNDVRLSQADVGAVLGVTGEVISHLESGRKACKFFLLELLAILYNKPVDFFCTWNHVKGTPSRQELWDKALSARQKRLSVGDARPPEFTG
jgi:transcriptional regulator with XRE-family HTH domain